MHACQAFFAVFLKVYIDHLTAKKIWKKNDTVLCLSLDIAVHLVNSTQKQVKQGDVSFFSRALKFAIMLHPCFIINP